jgi:hypothetical protein
MKRCMIETGDPVLTAKDAVQMEKKELIKGLETFQMEEILFIEGLIEKLREP